VNELQDSEFKQRIADSTLEDLVRLQWEMIDRFRELKGMGTMEPGSRLPIPTYPEELYQLLPRINAVMRQIREKRDSQAEAPIVPEVRREIERLEQASEEVQA
jgi:hypothetical protein